jgi:hypothetical protein
MPAASASPANFKRHRMLGGDRGGCRYDSKQSDHNEQRIRVASPSIEYYHLLCYARRKKQCRDVVH